MYPDVRAQVEVEREPFPAAFEGALKEISTKIVLKNGHRIEAARKLRRKMKKWKGK